MSTVWASQIAEATDGWVNNRMLQNWRQQGAWITPSFPTETTAAYPYQLEHMFEACIVAELNRMGLDQKLARAIIHKRILDYMKKIGNRAADAAKMRRPQLSEIDIRWGISHLPEFCKRRKDRKDRHVWAIFVKTPVRGSSQTQISVHLADRNKSLAYVLGGCGGNSAPAILLDISEIMKRVRAVAFDHPIT